MIRFLIFSLYSSFLLVSCAVYRYPEAVGMRESEMKELNTYYIDTTKAFVYRAKVNAFKQDVSGTLLVKALAADEHRIALVSDFGQTLFDLTISPDKDVVHFIMPDLDKKFIRKEIAGIFRTMTQRTFASSALMFSGKQHYPVYVSNDSYYLLKQREVDRITKTKGTKERFTVIYNDVNSGIPLGVTVEHQQLPITIHLFLDRNQSTL